MALITALDTFDVRFQTSRELDGSDAMNPDPDYSAAYVSCARTIRQVCVVTALSSLLGGATMCKPLRSLRYATLSLAYESTSWSATSVLSRAG